MNDERHPFDRIALSLSGGGTRAVGFRFHKSADDRPSGSEFAILPSEYAKQARLCDILASSTCIPVGFEPFEFPDDFRWPDDTASVPKVRKTCDAICRQMPEIPNKPDSNRSITLLLLTGSTLFMGYAYFSILSDTGHFESWRNHIWDMFIYVIPLLLLLACVGGGLFLSGRLKDYFGSQPAFRNNPELRPRLWKYFKKLFQQAAGDWEKLKANPYYLMNDPYKGDE